VADEVARERIGKAQHTLYSRGTRPFATPNGCSQSRPIAGRSTPALSSGGIAFAPSGFWDAAYDPRRSDDQGGPAVISKDGRNGTIVRGIAVCIARGGDATPPPIIGRECANVDK